MRMEGYIVSARIIEGGFWDNLQMGGGRDIVWHRARTDSSIDILAKKNSQEMR